MKRFGQSLAEILSLSKYGRFSIKTVVQIGLQLLDNLECLHDCGYIHCDLKPENILLAALDRNSIKSSEIVLIDFGLAKSFLTADFKHKEMETSVKFSGNFLFQSYNAFKALTLSRRDDLISLAYLLVFYFDGTPKWADEIDDDKPYYDQFRDAKLPLTPEKLCEGFSEPLLPFVTEVFAYEFKQEPNYAKLK